MEATTTTPVNMPPLIRAARLAVDTLGALHVDNVTGCIIHDKKVERALARAGIDLDDPDVWNETERKLAEPILIRRKRGGPPLNPVMLDITTAGMLLAVWDAINDANKARMPALIARLGAAEFAIRMWKFCK